MRLFIALFVMLAGAAQAGDAYNGTSSRL